VEEENNYQKKILVVDDETTIRNLLNINLTKEGYNVLKAENGKKALEILNENLVHLAILDIMMPEMDGTEVLTKIRKENSIPVIMLSAKSEDEDKINGLNLGADDYITKPFNSAELIARVNANIRRYTSLVTMQDSKTTYKTGDLILDDEFKKVSANGKEVKVTATEYNILKFLLSVVLIVFLLISVIIAISNFTYLIKSLYFSNYSTLFIISFFIAVILFANLRRICRN